MNELKEMAKQNHAERVAKTPERIEYAKQQFEQNGIRYSLKNSSNGHFHCFDSLGNLFQFWCSTGKIFYDKKVEEQRKLKRSYREWRGIHNLIKLLVVKEQDTKSCPLKSITDRDAEKAIQSLKRNASAVLSASTLLDFDCIIPVDKQLKNIAEAIDGLYDAYGILLKCYKQEGKAK